MTISESDVIQAVKDRTAYSIQTKTEAETTPTALNTSANILYNDSSRTQGNFSNFYLDAQAMFAEDLARLAKQATEAQSIRAYALLIGSLQDSKDPDTFAQSVSVPGYSVSRSLNESGYYTAYRKFLLGLPLVDFSPDDSIVDQVSVSENYPDDYRLSALNRNGKAVASSYTDPW